MKNLVFFLFTIILGVFVFTNDVAILTTKNGKIIENNTIFQDEAYSLAFYRIFNDLSEKNIIDLFFMQPKYIYDSVKMLINLEIKEKYLLDKGLTIDSTNTVEVKNIDNDLVKKDISKIFSRKNEIEKMLRTQLKLENNLEIFVENNKNLILEKFDVFLVEQFNLSTPATPTEDFLKNILESTPVSNSIIYEKNILNNFKDFEFTKFNSYVVYYNDNAIFFVKKITDPLKLIDYGLKDELYKYYEDILLENWEDYYPDNFYFILTYKPLKIQDRIEKLEDENLENLVELKNFYSDLIFNEAEVPEIWLLSYYNILSKLEALYLQEINEMKNLASKLPEEYFDKNFSEIQKITKESTSSTLTNYLNFYKGIIYNNFEINSKDSYLELVNSYDDEYKEIYNEKLKVMNLIIKRDFKYFITILMDKYDLTYEEAQLMYYSNFFEYIKSLNIEKNSDVFLTFLEKLNSLQNEKEIAIFQNLIDKVNMFVSGKE